LFAWQCSTQNIRIGPYAEIATPTGDFAQTNKSGVGAGLGLDIRLSRIALIGSAGLLHFGETVNEGENQAKCLRSTSSYRAG